MLRLLILMTFVTTAFAREEFPEKELREGYGQLLLVKVGSEFYNPDHNSGQGKNFDAAKALASCDAIDKNLKETFAEKKKFVYEAKALWEKNDPKWDQQLRDALQLGGAAVDGVPLKQSIRAHTNQRWSCAYYSYMPCHDRDSFDRVTALSEDPSLIDDPPFNTCVRLVKALRKSGECSYDQSLVDKACSEVTGNDVLKASVVDDGKKQTIDQARGGKASFEKTNLIGVDDKTNGSNATKPKIVIPRPTSGE